MNGELQVQPAQAGRKRESDSWARVRVHEVSLLLLGVPPIMEADISLIMSDHIRVVDLATRP
jgi:hypothetical protein